VQIQVNQEERQLTLSGERRRANGAGNATEEEGSKSTSASSRRRSERRFGKFERKFKLPEDADLDAVSARSILYLSPDLHNPFILLHCLPRCCRLTLVIMTDLPKRC
jgi:hypothetical protein